MRLTIESNVAERYGLHGAAVLAYLTRQHDQDVTPEGWFAAPHIDLMYHYKITRKTFTRVRDQLVEDGILQLRKQPNLTYYRINWHAMNRLVDRGGN